MDVNLLNRKIQTIKDSGFKLPSEVSSHQTRLSNGNLAYVFRHSALGELGMIQLMPVGSETQFNCELAGDVDDPMTAKRRAIFEPMARELVNNISKVMGASSKPPKPYNTISKKHKIQSKVFPCKVCSEITSMLIFAPEARTAGELEDYNRLMYSKIQELKVPTWIIGYGKTVVVKNCPENENIGMKAYPVREPVKLICSADLNPILDRLMNEHC